MAGTDREQHHDGEQAHIQAAADEQTGADDLFQAEFFSELGHDEQGDDAQRHGDNAGKAHNADVAQYIGVHIGE